MELVNIRSRIGVCKASMLQVETQAGCDVGEDLEICGKGKLEENFSAPSNRIAFIFRPEFHSDAYMEGNCSNGGAQDRICQHNEPELCSSGFIDLFTYITRSCTISKQACAGEREGPIVAGGRAFDHRRSINCTQ